MYSGFLPIFALKLCFLQLWFGWISHLLSTHFICLLLNLHLWLSFSHIFCIWCIELTFWINRSCVRVWGLFFVLVVVGFFLCVCVVWEGFFLSFDCLFVCFLFFTRLSPGRGSEDRKRENHLEGKQRETPQTVELAWAADVGLSEMLNYLLFAFPTLLKEPALCAYFLQINKITPNDIPAFYDLFFILTGITLPGCIG